MFPPTTPPRESSSSSPAVSSPTMSSPTMSSPDMDEVIALLNAYKVRFLSRLPPTLYRVTHPQTAHHQSTPSFESHIRATSGPGMDFTKAGLKAAIQGHLDGLPSWFLATFSDEDDATEYAEANMDPGEDAIIYTIETRLLQSNVDVFCVYELEDSLGVDLYTEEYYQGDYLFFGEIPERALVNMDFYTKDLATDKVADPPAYRYLQVPRGPPKPDSGICIECGSATGEDEDAITRYEIERELIRERNGDREEEEEW